MKHLLSVLILISVFAFNLRGQCPPSNATMTITGLYSADLNPAPGNTIYVTSTGTITGNINLQASSLYNCGIILSRKITMRQALNNYVLENNNYIKCDTISLDSLGHLHNFDTLVCGFLKMSYGTNVDNSYLMDINNFLIEKESKLNSQGTIKTSYFEMKDNYTRFFNLYGTISARKLFKLGIGTDISGIIFICADSCFINDGSIINQAMQTWTPSIRVSNLSSNTGVIYDIDFCDLTSSTGGMPDINTGSLTNVTFCSSQQYYCDYSFTGLKENSLKTKTVIVFPNPTSNSLGIRADYNEFDNSEIEIINYLGQTVLKLPYSNNISVSTLSAGYYTLKILSPSGQFHSNFIKE